MMWINTASVLQEGPARCQISLAASTFLSNASKLTVRCFKSSLAFPPREQARRYRLRRECVEEPSPTVELGLARISFAGSGQGAGPRPAELRKAAPLCYRDPL